MAVIARDSITLASINDVANARRYYKLQASTAPAPLVPTTNPPSGWDTTEPTYVEGNTDTLYTVDLTVFSDGTFDYSPVSVSSTYEAAKVAYNKALAAQGTATNALNSANGRNQRVAGITDPPTGTTNALTGLPWRDGDTWVKWNNTTNRHVIGQWTREGTAWKAEYIESAFIANLDLNKLTVLGSGYMTQAVVDKIVGDAAYYKLFTADRIQLQAMGASLYYDGNFSDPGLSALRASNSPTWTYNSTAKSMTGTGTFWLTYNAQDEALTVPLVVGQKYRAKVWGTGLTSAAKTFARRDDAGYTQLPGVTYGSGYMEVVFDVPSAGARLSVYPKTTASATITRVELAPLVGGTIIEPGGIDTPHLKSDAIDGMTITGATIQTVVTANRGVKIDTAGLRAYDNSGNLTVQLTGTGGTIKGLNIEGGMVTGATVRTNSTGTRAQLVDNAVSWYSNGVLIAELFQVGEGLRMLAGQTGFQSDIMVSKDVDITSDQHIRLRPTAMNAQAGTGRVIIQYDLPVSQWESAEVLFLDANGVLYKWGNAPQRPVVANGTVPAGTAIAPGNFYNLTLYYSVTRTPRAVLSDIASFPAGSGYLTTRVASWSASSCLVRVVNTGTSTYTVPSGGMAVRAVVLV